MSQLGCLPSLLGDGAKGIEIVNGEEKNILYRADCSSQDRTEPLKFVLVESPFTSVSTASRGRPSLVSLSSLVSLFTIYLLILFVVKLIIC